MPPASATRGKEEAEAGQKRQGVTVVELRASQADSRELARVRVKRNQALFSCTQKHKTILRHMYETLNIDKKDN